MLRKYQLMIFLEKKNTFYGTGPEYILSRQSKQETPTESLIKKSLRNNS